MNEVLTFWEWLAKGLMGALMAVAVFFGKRSLNRLDNDISEMRSHLTLLGDSDRQCKMALTEFKLESEKSYASKAEMQQSLARIHDRIDAANEGINDIKTILINKK